MLIWPKKLDRRKVVQTIEVTSTTPPNFEPTDTHQLTYNLWSNPILVESYTGEKQSVLITNRTPNFFTSNAAIATVNGTGLVTAVAVGECDITIAIDNNRATVHYTVTSPQSGVTQVTVTPTSATGTIGTQVIFEARARDSNGNALLGKTITWFTSDSLKVSVTADSGDELHQTTAEMLATGGSPFIRASCEGIDSANVPITVDTGTVLFANRLDRGNKTGSSAVGYSFKNSGNATVQPIPAALPNGLTATNALRHRHTTGNPNQEQRITHGDQRSELFIGFYIYHDAAFVHRNGPSTDNHKFWRSWSGNKSDLNDGYSQYHVKGGYSTQFACCGMPAGDARLISEFGEGSGCGNGTVGEGGGGTVIPAFPANTAEWTKVQLHLKLATGAGTNDGVLEVWLNDVLKQSRTNLDWRSTCAQNFFDMSYIEGAANQGWDTQTDVFTTRIVIATTFALSDPDLDHDWIV